MNWIDVKKELPKIEDKYLVCIDSGLDIWIEIAFYFQNKFTLVPDGSIQYITHWMELPNLPSVG
jgi:hypothetical protein